MCGESCPGRSLEEVVARFRQAADAFSKGGLLPSKASAAEAPLSCQLKAEQPVLGVRVICWVIPSPTSLFVYVMLYSMCGKMWTLAFANVLPSLFFLPLAGATMCPSYGDVEKELGTKLSPGSSITNTNAPRWSLYGAPSPAFVVNVNSESDVTTTVRYKPYVSQNG